MVKNRLRQCIVFARHNLLSDPPFTKMDLVVCRNALIYFRSVAQDRVLRRLQYSLSPKGYLFLGSSESLGDLQRDFQTLSARHKIWQITPPHVVAPGVWQPPQPQRPTRGHGGSRAAHVWHPSPGGQQCGGHGLFHPAQGVRAACGHADRRTPRTGSLIWRHSALLHMREGQASLDINRLLAEPLVPVAAALLFKSARENTSVTSDVVRLPQQGTIVTERGAPTLQVKLSAWPVGEVDGHCMSLLAFRARACQRIARCTPEHRYRHGNL